MNRWKYLVLSVVLGAAGMYIFVMDVALPAQQVFFGTMGSFPTVISVAWLPFLLAGALCKFAEYYWNMFNRSSMISHSYEITEDSLLTGLPSAYSVYGNVRVGDADISHVVIGPNGVFVISDRSVNGTIYDADENERRWEIQKVGRGGTEYTSSMANPLKQVGWQVHQLLDCFKKNDCPNLWIEGVVLFSSGTILSNSDKVFSNPDALIDYIVHYNPRKPVNTSAIETARRILADLGRLEGVSSNVHKQSRDDSSSPLKWGIIAALAAVLIANTFSNYQFDSAMKEIHQHNKAASESSTSNNKLDVKSDNTKSATSTQIDSFSQHRDKVIQDSERIQADYERMKQYVDSHRRLSQ